MRKGQINKRSDFNQRRSRISIELFNPNNRFEILSLKDGLGKGIKGYKIVRNGKSVVIEFEIPTFFKIIYSILQPVSEKRRLVVWRG